MPKSLEQNIFGSELDEIKEVTYEDVKEFMDTVLNKAPNYAIVEELENTAEYVVILEKILEEHGIDFSDDVILQTKLENSSWVEDQKRLFLLHFAGKIVRKEGSVV